MGSGPETCNSTQTKINPAFDFQCAVRTQEAAKDTVDEDGSPHTANNLVGALGEMPESRFGGNGKHKVLTTGDHPIDDHDKHDFTKSAPRPGMY